jgi:hypothetical protein
MLHKVLVQTEQNKGKGKLALYRKRFAEKQQAVIAIKVS